MFGHQEIISHVCLNSTKTFIMTVDEAKKVKISHFPKVVSMHSVVFTNDKATFADFIGEFTFFTYCKGNKEICFWVIEGDTSN